MIKTINYLPKVTAAKTTYININDEDMQFVQLQLMHYLSLIGEWDNTNDETQKEVNRQYFHKRRKELPKGQYGLNSPVSFISGLLNNILFGTQRDLTERQIEGIESISAVLAQIWSDLPAIQFRIKIV
jgi:hypothetical protein